MTKEELIKLIDNLEIAEVQGFNIIYFDKAKKEYSSENRELRNINYNFNIKEELQNIRRNVDGIYLNINKEINYMIEEKLNERGVK